VEDTSREKQGVKVHYDCIKDQIVPIGAAGLLFAKILKNATLKVYAGFPHGMPTTNADQINADLLTLFKGAATAAPS
jgi:non-heme chloroperoxidase